MGNDNAKKEFGALKGKYLLSFYNCSADILWVKFGLANIGSFILQLKAKTCYKSK